MMGLAQALLRSPPVPAERPYVRAARTLVAELPGLAPAALVVVLLISLLLPLPTALVDLLLSLSLAGAVVVLIAALRVPRPADFSGFPTLVLLLALFRLALNVSTTRLILSQADAGRVIDAFSTLVVRGDLLIGAVLFSILTAIQYVVIARGAERVAEVAARFTLDAMPGQQAAIEADLRAGAIGSREAAVRRAALTERADYYGRMDGVMRWVKGDAVVGLIIVATNVVGGLAIGATRDGRGLAESLQIYGSLAIGDGLLAQLPALLTALAAALLVARVDRDPHDERPLRWLDPATLLVPAVLLGALALVPGMPWLAFATTAAGLVAVALVLARRPLHRTPPAIARAIVVRCSFVGPDEATFEAAFEGALLGLRDRCERTLGLALPAIELELAAEGLPPDTVELRHGGRVLGRERVAEPTHDGLTLACFHVLMARAEHLVELETLERAVERQRRAQPSLVRHALVGVELIDLLAIVRGFVRERIRVPELGAVLQVLAEDRVFRDPAERRAWPEHARVALADHWVRDLCDGVSALGEPRWLRPSADLEALILARTRLGDRGATVGLSSDQRARLLAAIAPTEAGANGHTRPTIIVCNADSRPGFAALVAESRPHVPVLALGELAAAAVDLPVTEVLDGDGC